MSKKFKRSINYFEITTKNEIKEVRDSLKLSIDRINHNEKKKRKKRFRELNGNTFLQIKTIKTDSFYYSGCAKLVRNEFPEVADKATGETTLLDQEKDDTKGIPEETHFVICHHPKLKNPIIAIESTIKGPRENNINYFLSYALRDKKIDDDFIFTPKFAFDINKLEDRLNGVAKMRITFHRDNIGAYEKEDTETGELFAKALEYADSEYITMEFGIHFNKKNRLSSQGIMGKLRSIINLLKKKPKTKELFSKLEVKAPDSLYDDKIRVFDLIKSRVASEVKTEKRRIRAQYYNSPDLYEAIKKQIFNDFDLKGKV